MTAPAYSKVSLDKLCPPSVHQTHIDLVDLHLFDYEEFGVDDEETTYRSAAIREIGSHRENIFFFFFFCLGERGEMLLRTITP